MTSDATYDAIVIGAGVVGPAIATALARQGRKVLIVERDWLKPDRIVGELLQPGGLKALKELGMAQAVNNIDAIYHTGYYINFEGQNFTIEYPEKADALLTNAVKPVPGCVSGDNDKLLTDATILVADWDKDSRVRGVAFHHGDFLGNLRGIVRREKNVTWIEGTVTALVREDQAVCGVEVKTAEGKSVYRAKLTVCCDGIYSKFRRELSPDNTPTVGLYFVGLHLENPGLPAPHHGHVILGKHAPILFYQISPTEARILCAYRLTKPPSQTSSELYDYLRDEVLPALPEPIRPAFRAALKTKKFRSMPNQYLPARKQGAQKGLVVLGDALNMRHPLTGGGMTVGLNDASLMARLLAPGLVPDLADHDAVSAKLARFHRQRKNLSAVINTLSIALYALFAADKRALQILQRGCYRYLLLGGDCASGPIGLLSGMLPFPMLLFNHFFSVAFYAIYLNFGARGLLGFPVALYEAFDTIITAIVIFTPYLWHELVN